jgi:hypothetical protein
MVKFSATNKTDIIKNKNAKKKVTKTPDTANKIKKSVTKNAHPTVYIMYCKQFFAPVDIELFTDYFENHGLCFINDTQSRYCIAFKFKNNSIIDNKLIRDLEFHFPNYSFCPRKFFQKH